MEHAKTYEQQPEGAGTIMENKPMQGPVRMEGFIGHCNVSKRGLLRRARETLGDNSIGVSRTSPCCHGVRLSRWCSIEVINEKVDVLLSPLGPT